jgi:hypothetical protein
LDVTDAADADEDATELDATELDADEEATELDADEDATELDTLELDELVAPGRAQAGAPPTARLPVLVAQGTNRSGSAFTKNATLNEC